MVWRELQGLKLLMALWKIRISRIYVQSESNKRWTLENFDEAWHEVPFPFVLNETFSIVPRTLPGVMLLFHHAILQWPGPLPTHLHYRRRDL